MRRHLSVCFLAAALAATLPSAGAGDLPTNLLPNPSFERGQVRPEAWSTFALHGANWEFNGHDGERCVSVSGTGEDTAWWDVRGLGVKPNSLYRVSYWVRRDRHAIGGAAVAGLDWVGREALVHRGWERREFFLRTPDTILDDASFRVGQRQVDGKLYFDQVSLTPAVVAHCRRDAFQLPLGGGEATKGGSYTAKHELSGPASTEARFLERFDARFDRDRWVFQGPGSVVYRHRLGRLRQTEAEIEVAVCERHRGVLSVEASTDGESWVVVGEIAAPKRVAFPVPVELLPTRELWVRLRSAANADLSVDGYCYRCRLLEGEATADATGASCYLAVVRQSSEVEVEIVTLGDPWAGARTEAEVLVSNQGPRRLLRVALSVVGQGGEAAQAEGTVSVGSGASRRVTLGYEIKSPGDHALRVTCAEADEGAVMWEAECGLRVLSGDVPPEG